MSTILPSLPAGKPSVYLPAKRDSKPPSQDWLAQLLAGADIHLNGSRPWDMQIKHPQTLQRLLQSGGLALGESYMDGWWECQAIDLMVERAMRAGLQDKLTTPRAWWEGFKGAVNPREGARQSRIVGRMHYDVGNQVFQAMLDPYMTNSCAYWVEGAQTLEEAQVAKLEMVCRKLQLRPGMRVLDMGCGWGSFMRYAAEHYGVTVLGLSNAAHQIQLGQSLASHLPVQFELSDYGLFNTDGKSKFDRIVSIGPFEQLQQTHVAAFFETAKRCLKDDGWMLLQTQGISNRQRLLDAWNNKYIYPQGYLPRLDEVTQASEAHFVVEDVHNIGADHDRTLLHWHQRFEMAWPQLRLSHDERFYRMWRFHLLSGAASFRTRHHQMWQLVLSPKGLHKVYRRNY
jgi:cyclopropane-fatty-acyl-phospholipid synthase